MAAGMTQDALAAKCALQKWEIDRQIVAHIEAGNREVSDLELYVLCRILKSSPNELLGWTKLEAEISNGN
jgi:transcriptional regulator with XRE-family HTH domain